MKTKLLIASIMLMTATRLISQNNITIYRLWVTEDNQKEKIRSEHIYFRKDSTEMIKIYISDNNYYADYIYTDYKEKLSKILARVSNYDSIYYQYISDYSAITYSTREGKNIKNSKLIFNKKNKPVLELGYLYNTNDIATYTRNTYVSDTLLTGSAGYYIYLNDTSQTDSTYYTYDSKGRQIGKYPMMRSNLNSIDSSLIWETEYIDSTEISWDYNCDQFPCKKIKRSVQKFDGKHYLLEQVNYDWEGILSETVKYTYIIPKGEKYRETESATRYNSNGSIIKKLKYRGEVIKK